MSSDPRELECPYPGLEAFTAANRHYFFGRTNDTQLLISNLYASPLTVVYGASGVGKTSVILAGVVPEVEREGDAAILVHRTWQDAARARSLGERLARHIGESLALPPIAHDVPLDQLAERVSAAWRRPIFLVFDQFEEYFLYNEASDAPDSLDGELARLINRRDIDVNVMIVLREDSLAALDRFRHRIPTLLNNLFRLEHLTPDEARQAIERPLEVLRENSHGADLPIDMEEGLAAAVLDDLAALDRGAIATGSGREAVRVELPFLQVVLERIWLTECRAHSRLVRRATFSAAGGARGIVRQRVQESLESLSANEQQVAAGVLRHLVTPSGAKIALTMADLVGYAGANEATVGAVVQRLASSEARVLRRVTHPSADPALTKYEIYHDALSAPLLAWRVEMDRRRDEVLRRAKRRVRDSMVALGVLVLIVAFVAVSLKRGKSRVEAREIASVASGQLEIDNARAMLLAIASIDRSPDEDAGEVVLRRALFEPGERLRGEAPPSIDELTISSDGRYVVGTSRSGATALWLADSLRPLALPAGITNARGASFDSSNRHVLVADSRRPLVLTLDSLARGQPLLRGSGSVPAALLLHGGDRALVSQGSVVVEWALGGAAWSEAARSPTGLPAALELIVSPDERWVAWVAGGGLVIIDRQVQPWIPRRIEVPGGSVTHARFASRNEIAVATGADSVQVFRVESLEREEVIKLSCRIRDFVVANGEAAGRCLESGIVLFNLPRMRSQARMGSEPALQSGGSRFSGLTMSPDGRFIATIPSDDQPPIIWSTYSRAEVTRLRGHRGAVRAVRFLPDSRRVVTAGEDSTIRVWEVVTSSQRIGDGEFMAGRAHVVLNDATTRAAMIGPYGVQLWDLARGRTVVEGLVESPLPVLAMSREGDRVSTLSSTGQVTQFSEGNQEGTTRWTAPLDTSRAFTMSGRRLPAVRVFNDRSELRYLGATPTLLIGTGPLANDTSDRAHLLRIGVRADSINEVAQFQSEMQALDVDSSGTRLVVGLADGHVYVHDGNGARLSVEFGVHGEGATAVALGAGGAIASGGTSGDVQVAVYSARSSSSARPGATVRAVTLGSHDRGIVRLAFNRGGTVLASGDDGGTVRLWSVPNRAELCSLEGQHADFIRGIAFAPSGRSVATADERGVAIWFIDEANGSCRFGYRLVDLESPTEAMRFAPDGSALWLVGSDGVIRRYARAVWAPRDSLLAFARRRLRGRQLTPAEVERYTKSR